MTRALAAASLVLLAGVRASIGAESQPAPADLSSWTSVEYLVAGGIAGNLHRVTVARDGALTAADRRLGMDVEGRASADLLAQLSAFVKTARPAVKTVPMPDAIGASLTVTASGRTSEIGLSPDLRRALESAWSAAIAGAIAGTWTQSGWAPCRPAAQMTSTDLDASIDDLTLRADGTFSVTWRGGGARTTGVPHVVLPDYSGTYTLNAALGMIQFRPPAGVAPPRDFTGDGSFQIGKGTLTLKNVWLGTRAAPKRPDICELTFSRK